MSATNQPHKTLGAGLLIFAMILFYGLGVLGGLAYAQHTQPIKTVTQTQTLTTTQFQSTTSTPFGVGGGQITTNVTFTIGTTQVNHTWTDMNSSQVDYFQTRVVGVAMGEDANGNNVTVIIFDNSTVYGISACNTEEFPLIYANGTQAYNNVKIGDILSVEINSTNTWQQYSNSTNITMSNSMCRWTVVSWSVVN